MKQALLQLVKSEIRRNERFEISLKERIKELWTLSVPGTQDGLIHFNTLNMLKIHQRSVKLKIKKLAAIAKELKGGN